MDERCCDIRPEIVGQKSRSPGLSLTGGVLGATLNVAQKGERLFIA